MLLKIPLSNGERNALHHYHVHKLIVSVKLLFRGEIFFAFLTSNETVHNVSPCLFLILHLALPRCESCVPLLMFRMQSLDLQCIMCQQAGFKHLSWRKVDFIALSQSLFTVQNIYLDIVLACCLNPCVVIIQLLFSEKFQTAFETPTFFMHHKI